TDGSLVPATGLGGSAGRAGSLAVAGSCQLIARPPPSSVPTSRASARPGRGPRTELWAIVRSPFQPNRSESESGSLGGVRTWWRVPGRLYLKRRRAPVQIEYTRAGRAGGSPSRARA